MGVPVHADNGAAYLECWLRLGFGLGLGLLRQLRHQVGFDRDDFAGLYLWIPVDDVEFAPVSTCEGLRIGHADRLADRLWRVVAGQRHLLRAFPGECEVESWGIEYRRLERRLVADLDGGSIFDLAAERVYRAVDKQFVSREAPF